MYNLRALNDTRQDTLLYFSDELVKLQAAENASASNVIDITHPRRIK